MLHDKDRKRDVQKKQSTAGAQVSSAPSSRAVLKGLDYVQGKAALSPETGAAVQCKGTDGVRAAAAEGVRGGGGALPHMDRIQASFGDHDVSGVKAHVGGAAAAASKSIGAVAYATGNDVAFANTPDLHTAAHEAAHTVQQRAGVSLPGGVGSVGDSYERQADAAADAVVAGKSASSLLSDGSGGGATGSIQRKETEKRVVGPEHVSEGDRSTTKSVSTDTDTKLRVESYEDKGGGQTETKKPNNGFIRSFSYPTEPRAVMFHRSGQNQLVGHVWWQICNSQEEITIIDIKTGTPKKDKLCDIMMRFRDKHGDKKAFDIWCFHNGVFHRGEFDGKQFFENDPVFQAGFEEVSQINRDSGKSTDAKQDLNWKGGDRVQKGLQATEKDGVLKVNPHAVPGAGTITTLPFLIKDGVIMVDVDDGNGKTKDKTGGGDTDVDCYVSLGRWEIYPREGEYVKGMYNMRDVLPNFPYDKTKPAIPNRAATFVDKDKHQEDKIYKIVIDHQKGHFVIDVYIYPVENQGLVFMGTTVNCHRLTGAAADEYMKKHFVQAPVKKHANSSEWYYKGMATNDKAPDASQLNAEEQFFMGQFRRSCYDWSDALVSNQYTKEWREKQVTHTFANVKMTTQRGQKTSAKLLKAMMAKWDGWYTAEKYTKRTDQYGPQYKEIMAIFASAR